MVKLLLIISAIISSKTIITLRYFPRLHSSIFLKTPCISFEYSIKDLGLLCFKSHFHTSELNIDILLHRDLFHINIFYQYLGDSMLDLIMHWFFLINNLLLLVFCMDDLEFMATLGCVPFYFHLCNHQN